MARKVRLIGRPALPRNVQAGTILYPSAGIMGNYQREFDRLVTLLYKEAFPMITEELKRMQPGELSVAMDASDNLPPPLLPGLAILINRLQGRFQSVADDLAAQMVGRVERSSTTDVKRSLKDISKDFEINFSDTPAVESVIRDRINDNVRLITRIPQEFLTKLSTDVQKAVLKGKGLNEVQVLMAERYGTQSNWYKQVAMDQVNKAYMAINAERMTSAGVSQAEWIHRPVAREPRHYHERNVRLGGLNGLIFDIKNPPIIDERTGQRGLPGQLPFCHCVMRPIITPL